MGLGFGLCGDKNTEGHYGGFRRLLVLKIPIS